MSLLFIDSFDYATTAAPLVQKWGGGTTSNMSVVSGRTGNCVKMGGSASLTYYTPSNLTTAIVGFAFYTDTSNTNNILGFVDSSSWQVYIKYNGVNRALDVYGGGSLLDSTPNSSVDLSTWYYIELKSTINNSSGSVILKINGVEYINLTSQDTQVSANAYIDRVILTCAAEYYRYFDDVYILDTSGSVNNDFLGDIKVECIKPTGAGNQTDFTPSTGSNWQNVDDATPDNDSTYNYHAPQGLPGTDLFQMGDLTTISGSIFGIQPIMYTRKDDAGSADLYSVIRTGGTDYVGSGISLGDTYVYHIDILEENPDTATAWTVTDINNIEGGYRRTS